ncbi:MAG: hypothetical protein R3264_15040, partial [Anaerolineae bacterium]|nr:hypothetical protein [Anaerolineae bacterium]
LLKEHCAQAKIIVMTNFKDEALINAALEAGASGYMQRIVSLDRLADEIRAVFRLTPPDLHQSTQMPDLQNCGE